MVDLTFSIADQNFATTKSIGIYNYSIQLCRHISQLPELSQLTVFSNRTICQDMELPAKAQVELHDSAIGSRLGRILWDQWGVYRSAKASGRQWLFLPKGFCSFMTRPPVKVAACVHDIMGDYYNRRYPNYFPLLESKYFTNSLKATIRNASVIFTNTEFSKKELMGLVQRQGYPEPHVVVAGYGFDAVDNHGEGKKDRVLLFVSKVPHKRTDIAVRFLKRWQEESRYKGVIDCIGIVSPEMTKPEAPNWNWIGRVPPGEGRKMIRRASAIVYVSEYEGFGMPPVEAVLEGTCPVYSDIPPLREVMGNVGFSFSNDSEESFCQAMNRALATPPMQISEWAACLLRRHNWSSVTEKVMRELSTT
jgi:Glycosyl transferases group 1